ncbi:hypothetical protein BJV74DRAFT_5162 [Russula compacta]|nr:hypothetical protein BJV74DRAFT_5162 [Russula compacta]
MHVPVGIRSFKPYFVRSVQANTSSSAQSTSSPVPSSDAPLVQLSTSARSLIGTGTVVGAIFLAIIVWKLYAANKRRKARAVHAARISIRYGTSEKANFVSLADSKDVDEPRKPVLLPPVSSNLWVPQIKSVTLPSGVTVPPVAVTAPERSPKTQYEHPPTPNSGPSVSPLSSPPPAYRALGLYATPVPSSPPESALPDIPPPTPINWGSTLTAPTPVRESFDLPPVPSPRSASFHSIASTTSAPRTGLLSASTPKSLSQLMLVTTSFEPTLDDELRLRTGETLRLIKEFEDEWCLVQRVGPPDAEKGVVPRFCLTERPRIIKDYATIPNLTFNGVRRK